MVTMVTSPSRDKLLPDPVKPPYHQPPYTLLIELTGILVHPDWTYKTGWRFKKRPGVDYFLNQLSGYFFEVVIYTSELGFTAFPIIDALDTQNVVHYRLFRDSTKYDNGVHVKDLGKINRDLTKVIAIDWNEKSIHEHRNNALVLPRWKGNDDDRTLFDLAALLQTIGTSGIEDVRGVLEYYSKFDDPIAEFRKKQQELALREKEMSTDKAVGPAFTPASGWLGSLFRKT
jgi:import inner membrane translocase subunit TIM50